MPAITGNPGQLINVGFVPTSIAGCQLWMDAADTSSASMTLSGSTVTVWKDKSGNGNTTTARSGTSTLVSSAINGLSAISMSGGYFTGPFATPNTGTQLHAFAVISIDSSSGVWPRPLSLGRPGEHDFNDSTTTFAIIRYSGSQAVAIGRSSQYLNVGFPAYSSPFLVQSSHNGATEFMGVNGTLSPSSLNTGQTGNFNITSYGLGVNTNTSDYFVWNGYYAEVLYYNVQLSTENRQKVEGYLAQKWGLTASLPAGHPGLTTNYSVSQPPVFRITPFPGTRVPFSLTEIPPPPRLVLISNGLVSRWLLNESSGSTVIDSVGGNNITIGGSPSRASVTYGSYTGFALSLQTSTQVGSIPIPSNMNVTAHSMSSWVYFTGLKPSGQQRWLSWGSGGGCPGEDFATYLDTLYGGPSCIYGYSFLTSGLTTGVWYFCTSTYNGTTWTTYLNGTQVQTGNSGLNAVNGSFSIGYNQTADSITGGPGYGAYLGEIRFYNRALTAAEVLRIYEGTG
jgi:hypothetical protein